MIRKNRMILTVIFSSLILLLSGCGQPNGIYVDRQDGNEEPEDNLESSGNQQPDTEPEKQKDIYVQVSGAVVNPGVYCLPADSRIFQAIALAGGVTEEADLNSVNQALPLKDGQMVYVYAIGEEHSREEQGTGQGMNMDPADRRIDLNTATVEDLMTLPGIGQSKAESIIAYRNENGAFKSTEDIMNITGIKEGVFSKIKDYIKVN